MLQQRNEKISNTLSLDSYLETRKSSKFLLDDIVERFKGLLNAKDVDILDIGAGPGILAYKILNSFENQKKMFCSDIDRELVNIVKKSFLSDKDNMFYVIHGNKKLPFKDNSFDCVISCFSLHHFQYPQLMIKEMLRVLKKSKKAIIIDLNPDSLKLKLIFLFQLFCNMINKKNIRDAFLESVKFSYSKNNICNVMNNADIYDYEIQSHNIINKITIIKT